MTQKEKYDYWKFQEALRLITAEKERQLHITQIKNPDALKWLISPTRAYEEHMQKHWKQKIDDSKWYWDQKFDLSPGEKLIFNIKDNKLKPIEFSIPIELKNSWRLNVSLKEAEILLALANTRKIAIHNIQNIEYLRWAIEPTRKYEEHMFNHFNVPIEKDKWYWNDKYRPLTQSEMVHWSNKEFEDDIKLNKKLFPEIFEEHETEKQEVNAWVDQEIEKMKMHKLETKKLKRFNIIKDFTYDRFGINNFTPSYEIWSFDNYSELKKTLEEHKSNSIAFDYDYVDLLKCKDQEINYELFLKNGFIESSFKISVANIKISKDIQINELKKEAKKEIPSNISKQKF